MTPPDGVVTGEAQCGRSIFTRSGDGGDEVTTRATPRLRAVLANREFRALWFAETQSMLGDQLTIVALAILTFDRTGSPLLSAVVYSLTFLPALAGGLGLSQLADRFPRRTVLVTGSFAQAVLIGLMAVPGMPMGWLFALFVLARVANAPCNAAQNALGRRRRGIGAR